MLVRIIFIVPLYLDFLHKLRERVTVTDKEKHPVPLVIAPQV